MKRIISFKELYGSEIATYEVDGKHPGDALQNIYFVEKLHHIILIH